VSERAKQRYAPHGALALNPKAFGLLFDMPSPKAPALTENDVAIVTIRGPLMHHREWCFDSYEAIRERVAEAIELAPRFVLLAIDSPGGVVSGAFDTARDLRKMAEAAGVDLYAHVEGQATSAAYALATAAHWIGASRSAALGSIGVIDTLVDATAQNAAFGLDIQLVTSGARKSDGNPNVAITEDALASSQRRVDDFARMFFDLVSDHGWGDPAKIEALQAAIVTGEQAVQLGLATEVATLEQTIAFASPESMRTGAGAKATEDQKGRYTMAEPKDDAVASLRKMAEGEDEDEARKARAALKALGAEEDPDAEGDEPDAEGDEPDAQDDDEPDAKAQDDDDEPDAKSSAKAMSMAAKALAKVHNLEARAAKKSKREARSKLLATRPDISPDMVAILADPKMSDAQVTKILSTLEVGPARADRVAAAATATGTRGQGQGDGNAARLAPEERASLDAQMGLTEMSAETVNTPHRQTFGVRRPVAQKGK
jgi:ClpP class serine protease